MLALNKIDAEPCGFLFDWMKDLDSFTSALQEERSYMGSLAQSMALMLEEFYHALTAVGVSALTGEGMGDFFAAIDKSRGEYESTYKVGPREPRGAPRMSACTCTRRGAVVVLCACASSRVYGMCMARACAQVELEQRRALDCLLITC